MQADARRAANRLALELHVAGLRARQRARHAVDELHARTMELIDHDRERQKREFEESAALAKRLNEIAKRRKPEGGVAGGAAGGVFWIREMDIRGEYRVMINL